MSDLSRKQNLIILQSKCRNRLEKCSFFNFIFYYIYFDIQSRSLRYIVHLSFIWSRICFHLDLNDMNSIVKSFYLCINNCTKSTQMKEGEWIAICVKIIEGNGAKNYTLNFCCDETIWNQIRYQIIFRGVFKFLSENLFFICLQRKFQENSFKSHRKFTTNFWK